MRQNRHELEGLIPVETVLSGIEADISVMVTLAEELERDGEHGQAAGAKVRAVIQKIREAVWDFIERHAINQADLN